MSKRSYASDVYTCWLPKALDRIFHLSCRCISVLKDTIFGEAAPLGFLSQAITIMSGGMIPCMMLLLGSGLSKGPGNSGLPLRVIVGTVFIRLLVLPAIGNSLLVFLQLFLSRFCHCLTFVICEFVIASLKQSSNPSIVRHLIHSAYFWTCLFN